jgi:hypothetical protein
MTNLGRLVVIRLLAISMLLILPATAGAQERSPILDQVAKTYGIDSWDKIDAIRYTWNGEITGLFKAAHKWEWEPKTGKVTFEGVDKDGKPVRVSSTITTGRCSLFTLTGTRAPARSIRESLTCQWARAWPN